MEIENIEFECHFCGNACHQPARVLVVEGSKAFGDQTFGSEQEKLSNKTDQARTLR